MTLFSDRLPAPSTPSLNKGPDVKEGQPPYQIDPAPYQAMFDQAKAQLAYAEAAMRPSRRLSA